MSRRTIAITLGIVLLVHAWPAPPCNGQRARPEHWLRDGELGPTPQRVTDALPLSDQNNTGDWAPYELMTDEFNGETLDSDKWWPKNPGWLGRQPAYFWPGNVKVADGCLHLTMRKQEVPEMPKDRGYHTYTSAAVQSKTRVLYGYFEIRARPMIPRLQLVLALPPHARAMDRDRRLRNRRRHAELRAQLQHERARVSNADRRRALVLTRRMDRPVETGG